MAEQERLSIVVFAGGFDRVHYALVMASAAAATNRRVTLFFTGRALAALLPEDADGPGWRHLDPADDGGSPAERDSFFTANGLAGFEELLGACAALGVGVMACEMGLRALGLPPGAPLRADIPVATGGVVTFLNAAAGGATLFV